MARRDEASGLIIPAVEGRDPLIKTTPDRFRASVDRSLSKTRKIVETAREERRPK